MNWLKQNWIKTGIITLALIASWFLFSQKDQSLSFKCPDEYTSSEEKLADFDKWAEDFYNKNPKATIEDLIETRKQFYIDHNCQEALKRRADWDSGNVDPEVEARFMETTREVIESYR